MLRKFNVTNYDNVQLIQSTDQPHILIITQYDEYLPTYKEEIGRFNFYTKEGYLQLLNGTKKEYKRFNALMNNFFKHNEFFGWDSKAVENAQTAGKEMIKAEKKQLEESFKNNQIERATDFLNNVLNKDDKTMNIIDNLTDKTEEEMIKLINNTFKNVIPKKLTTNILNAIKAALQPTEEIAATTEQPTNKISENDTQQTETTNTTENTPTDTTYYIVGNRRFESYQQSEAYCLESDFDPSIMIEVMEGYTPTETQYKPQQDDNKPELYHLYKNTFKTYSEAFNYACQNSIYTHMIISSNSFITNDKLQQLEKDFTFDKFNMSYSDMLLFYKHLESISESLDQQDRYYKLKSMIQRYENKSRNLLNKKRELQRQQKEIGSMLEDMYYQGMVKKELGSYVDYYLNDNKIYSWSSGIKVETMYNELKEVYEQHFKQIAG